MLELIEVKGDREEDMYALHSHLLDVLSRRSPDSISTIKQPFSVELEGRKMLAG